jgi:hypothetical protein
MHWLRRAADQNDPNACFVLGSQLQHSDSSLSDHYFQRAKRAAFTTNQPQFVHSYVSGLSSSEQFAKWHYVNYHQRIGHGFSDGGRLPRHSDREIIVINEQDLFLSDAVGAAQKELGTVSGMRAV